MKTLKELLEEAWIHQYGNGKPHLNYEIKAVKEWLTQKLKLQMMCLHESKNYGLERETKFAIATYEELLEELEK